MGRIVAFDVIDPRSTVIYIGSIVNLLVGPTEDELTIFRSSTIGRSR